MAKFMIGGQEFVTDELVLTQLKKIFPIVKKMRILTREGITEENDNALDAIDQTIEIISIALEKTETPLKPDEIRDRLRAREIKALQPSLIDMLTENDLMVTETGPKGEPDAAPAAEVESPSTETLTQSSARSSPDLELQTGT